MRVIFRADASTDMGSGHVMRCLALAAELRRGGATVEFIHRQQAGDLAKYILEAGGYQVHVIDHEFASETDADLSAEALAGYERPAWMVVDHYDLGRRWEVAIRPHVERLMVIDDLADAPHDCDALLNQNLLEDSNVYDRLLPEASQRLIGPQYALLRPEFAIQRERLVPKPAGVKRILVSFGGTDPTGETGKFLRQLRESQFHGNVEVDCVVGQGTSDISELRRLSEDMTGVHLHVQTQEIARLMSLADVCIGAGGATTWERLCLGLPTLAVAVAANQVPNCELLSERGYCYYLGDATTVEIDYLGALDHAVVNEAQLAAIAAKGMTLVDGLGATRVAKKLLEA